MKVLLDIKDAKAPYLLEVLKGLSFVKTTQLTPYKAKVILQFICLLFMIKISRKI